MIDATQNHLRHKQPGSFPTAPGRKNGQPSRYRPCGRLLNRRGSIIILAGILAAFSSWGGESVPPYQLALNKMILTVRHRFPDVQQISTTKLAAWLADPARPQPQLLDVREPAEYVVSHLAGAIRISPHASAAKVMARINPHRPVVVYCSVGYRSSQLAQQLQRAGFTNVMNLEGSIFAWANEGRPLAADGHPATLVHPYNRKFGQMLKPSLRAPLKRMKL
jgi:rhodanese-related sulfurtransferase